jgi:hypothetical protein
MSEPSSGHIDTSRQVEIRIAPWQMLRLAGLGVVMTGLSAVTGFRLIDTVPAGGFGQFAGLIGVFFFGLCTIILSRRVMTTRGPVVTLGPEGIRDERIAKAVIPWTAIRQIYTWSSYGQKIMVLEIDPIVEAKLPLTRTVTWTRSANRRLGADGLCVASQGLDVSYDKLLAMATAYAEAARPA